MSVRRDLGPEGEDPLIGRTFGEFVVEGRIGEGGFGTVYRARQPRLGRLAALKVLHSWLGASGEATDRFLREARTASSLDHPYAAHVYSSGAEPDGTLWIAMEYVRGTPLSEYLREQGPLAVDRLIPFLERLCEVMQSAHEHGIVHRDIKPANVMVLVRAGRLLPKLLDFGIAKAILETAGAGYPAASPAGRTSDPEMAKTLPPTPPRAEAKTSPPARAPSASASPALDETAGAGLDETVASTPAGGGQSRPPPGEISPPSGLGGESEELTRRGQIVGTPHYMAPEQWQDSASVDARSDLYAIAVVAYEALTGKLPYRGDSPLELARARRTQAPPPVPKHLSPELDEAFAKALAAAPEARFQDALGLGSALRRASGVGDERPALPKLDDAVKHRFLADAPQPLADAVATLDAAREPRQARDALWSIADTLGWYLGLLALCARGRFRGPGGKALPPALRRAGAEVLSADAWLEVAEALVAQERARPDLYPVPELVLALCGEGDEPGEASRRFRDLGALRAELSSASVGDAALVDILKEALSRLSALLGRVEFVCDYPVVVLREGGGAERFSGMSRARAQAPRRVAEVRGAALSPGEPALCDGDGAPVLSLHPLVQLLRPSAEAPPELFLFAGGSERGGKLIAAPAPFERHDREVLDWLRLQLETTLDTRNGARERERSPYRGLEAYTVDDATLYVGREREVDGVANRLRVEPLLAVVGPSGAGKSSFVQAGVVPRMRDRGESWRPVVLRPGAAPLAALEARLCSAGIAADGLSSRLRDDSEGLGEVLREHGAAGGPVLLIVDQFEEIFTLTQSEAIRHAFVAALVAAARTPDDPVRIVLTLRDDFLVRAEAMPALRERLGRGLKLLTTPDRDDLERILVEPAERAGYAFEDPDLPGRMVAEVEGQPGALALLSFTASLLWERRDRHFQRLPTRAYEELGGVGGALAHHAEALLASLPQAERRVVREAFRMLVTSEGTRTVLGRAELLAALADGESDGDSVVENAIDQLVSGRLLVVSDGEAGEQIEVAHEALLTAWPRLVEWRRRDAEGARLRDQLRAAAVQWDRRGRAKGLLWRDDALAEYRIWRARYPGALTEVEEAFGRASLAEAKRSLRRRRAAVAGAFAALSAALAFVFALSQRADEARAIAEEQRAVADERAAEIHEQLLDSYLEQGSQALRSHDYHGALLFLGEAFEMGAEGPEVDFMISMAAAPFEARQWVARHEGSVWDARFSPGGDRLAIASSDGNAYLRDARDGSLVATLEGHEDTVFRAIWSPAGDVLATASWDGTVRLWDARTGESVRVVDHDGERVSALRFDPGGARIISATVAGTIRIFSARHSEDEVKVREGHRGGVLALAVDPAGERAASGGAEDGRILLWDVRTGEARGEIGPAGDRVSSIEFDGRGERLLAATWDGMARIFRTTGELEAKLRGHNERVNAGRFSPDGTRVATASLDGTARIWDAGSGRQLARLEGHQGGVGHVMFRHDGAEIVTSGADGTARLWDPETGGALSILPVDVGPLRAARYSPEGSRLLTVSEDGAVALWDAGAASPHRVLRGHDSRVVSVRTGGADRFVTASTNGTARIWNAEGEEERLVRHGEELRDADVDASGERLITVDERGEVYLWRLGAGSEPQRLGTGSPDRGAPRFSPDGSSVVIGGLEPTLWDLTTMEPLAQLDAGGAWLVSLGFAQAGSRLVAGDSEGKLWVLDAASGAVEQTIDAHSGLVWAVTFSPDGATIASGSRDGTGRLWDLETGNQAAVLTGHRGWVRDVDFGPDGALVATAGVDRTVRVWGAASGRELARLIGHTREVSGLAFSADGERLATSSYDGTVRLWDLPRRAWTVDEVRLRRRCLPLELRDGNPVPLSELPAGC